MKEREHIKWRRGRSIPFRWSIKIGGQVPQLAEGEIKLFMRNSLGAKVAWPYEIEDGNVLVFDWVGKDQKRGGVYSFTALYHDGLDDQNVLDSCVDIELVESTCDENDCCGCGDFAIEPVYMEGDFLVTGGTSKGAVRYDMQQDLTDEQKAQARENIGVEDELAGKQDKLISGENIKTINGTSVLGSGDIVIPKGDPGEQGPVGPAGPAGPQGPAGQDGAITEDAPNDGNQYARQDGEWVEVQGGGGGADPEAVHFTPQTLTEAQKSQARRNIGVGGTFTKITEFTTDGTENKAVVLLDDFSTYKEIVIIMKAATPENAQLRIDAGYFDAFNNWYGMNMWLSNTNAHYRMVWRIAIDDILTLTDCYAYNYSGDDVRLSIYKESGTCFGIDRTKKLAAFFYNNANAPAGKTFIVYAR